MHGLSWPQGRDLGTQRGAESDDPAGGETAAGQGPSAPTRTPNTSSAKTPPAKTPPAKTPGWLWLVAAHGSAWARQELLLPGANSQFYEAVNTQRAKILPAGKVL